MKRKGFTLIELLVVIAIIALLMGILMPALVRVRQLAIRMLCGTQLKGIGNAMMVYSNDNEDEYPIAGARIAVWGMNTNTNPAAPTYPHSDPTIAESFYILIRGGYTTPKQLICSGDWGTELKFSDYLPTVVTEWEQVINFPHNPSAPQNPIRLYDFCSYSYQLPYRITKSTPAFPVSALSDPESPVCADRNPYLNEEATYVDFSFIGEQLWNPQNNQYGDPDGRTNCAAHQQEGQNVLFNDFHVDFERHPNVGIDNDNIWMSWTSKAKPIGSGHGHEIGVEPARTGLGPGSSKDAYLVQDGKAP